MKTFFILVLLALGLRIAGLTFDSLWLDESYQSMTSAVGQTLPNFFAPPTQPFLFKFGAATSVHTLLANFKYVDPLCPPLYAVLLNRWMHGFGPGDFAIRILSTLFSVITIAVTYWFARVTMGERIAFLAGLLQAVSPFDIYYAQEARMYELVTLMAAISSFSLVMLLNQVCWRQAKWKAGILSIVYVGSTWTLINTHYTACFTVAFQGIYTGWWCLKQKQFLRLGAFGLLWLMVLVLWIPWLDIFLQAATRRNGSFYVTRTFSWLWPWWSLGLKIPFNWITFLIGKRVYVAALPVYLTATIMILLAVARTFNKLWWLNPFRLLKIHDHNGLNPKAADVLETKVTSYLGFLWCWALIPALLIWGIDVIENHKVVEIPRYVIACAPAIYLLAAVGLASLWNQTRVMVVLLAVHISCCLINNACAHVIPQREPWRQLAQTVERSCTAKDLILVSQYYDIVCLDRYLQHPYLQVAVSPNMDKSALAKIVQGRSYFWLITAQEGEAVKSKMPDNYSLVKQIDFHHALHLRLYKYRLAGKNQD